MTRFLVHVLLWMAVSLAGAADLLHPVQAFKPTARALDGQTVEVRFAIADGYYLYHDKFRFATDTEGVKLGVPSLPRGKEKMDETFGNVEVFYREVLIRLPVERNSSGVLPLILQITSQGCADVGVCYPPQKQQVAVQLPDPGSTPPLESDESGRIARLLSNAALWWVAASFFGFGVLLSLTPCTFPMLPILSGIIVGAGRNSVPVSHARGFCLALAYVLGMAVTYAGAGVAAALSGTMISSALQNAWVLGGFALVFVILALSMFGLFPLQLPSFLQSRISEEASHLKGGSIPGVVLMGALSSLIVGPCVAAPLAGALLYIAGTGDVLLGGMALFFMGFGMGLPLLAIGLSAGTLLPKAGPWMGAVNQVFGVLLLASAVWIVSPLLPTALQMLAWALLLIIPAVFLRAIDPLPPHAHGWQRFGKALGVIMLLLGAAMLVGALSGARDPLQPLSGFGQAGNVAFRHLPFERVRSLGELEARIASAGKPVMLDFYADWCVSCKEMERFTFSDARVQDKLSGWLLLQADVTANSAEDKELLTRFRLFGPPGIIFFDPVGQELAGVRVVGFQKADEFLATLAATRL